MTACEAGTFQSLPGQGSCTLCLEGNYCPNSTMTSSEDYPCSKGAYCEEGRSEPQKCEPGQYKQ